MLSLPLRHPLPWAMLALGLGGLTAAYGEDFYGTICSRTALPQTSASTPAFSAPPKGLSGIRITLIDTAGRPVANQITGKAGTFRIRKVEPGKYALLLNGKGFESKSRSVLVREEDEFAHWYYLDPISFAAPAPPKQKKNKPPTDPYAAWAKGFSAAALDARFWPAEGQDTNTTLGRFFNAEDTTAAYRQLWYSLLWLEVEADGRPLETRARLAHALSSTLPKDITLPFVTDYLEIAPDSLAAFAKTLKAMALNRPLDPKAKRAAPPRPSDLKTLRVPRAFGLELAIEVASSGLPLPKRKAMVAKLKGIFGAEGNRRLAEALKPSLPRARMAKPSPPKTSPSAEAIWAVVQGATKNNAVAQFHWARRKFEQGQWREAETWLAQATESRPDDGALLLLKTRLSLRKGDTASAFEAYSALARSESPAAQAMGERGLGELNFAAGRLDLAEQAFWRALGLDSKSPAAQAAIYALSAIALEKDSPNSVESLLDTLAKQHPKDARPHFWLGRFALKNKQDGLAASHFQQAVKLAPREVAYAEALAALQAAKEEWPGVYTSLKPLRQKISAVGLELYIEALLHTGRNGEAVSESERLYSLRSDAATLARLAQAMTTAKQAAKAISLIQKSSFAGDSAVRIALALAKIETGAGSEATAILRPMVEANPTHPVLHLHLGRALFAMRDYRRASDEFGEALRFRDDVPEALYHKGLCLVKLGSAVESHYYFTELIDRESPAWKAKGHLGRGQAFAAEGKPEAAEEQLRQALALEASSEAAAHLALTLLRQDKKAEAETWARKARSMDKNSALATLALSDILLESGREEAALTLAETELEANPRSCDHLVAAAKANFKTGLDDRAKEISETALKNCPGDPGPHFYLGAISARLGAKQEAKGHFEAYLEDGGDAQNLPRGYR